MNDKIFTIIDKCLTFVGFESQAEYNARSNAYLAQFKKKYADRTDAENILVEGLFYVEFSKLGNTQRELGAMEATLILNGVLTAGSGAFPLEKGEDYTAFIIRKTREFLTEKNIL